MKSPLNRGTGLRADSVVMLDNLTTVLDKHIERKIGSLSDMTTADAALRTALGI